MSNSQILKAFDESRDSFKPYGLTCELWSPGVMKRPDRHNEIELNYFPNGTITYFFQDKKLTIPKKRLAVFWALVPHQIIQVEESSPYYVCTIPFSWFLEWKLPSSFVDRILKGEVVIDESNDFNEYDEFLLTNWVRDTSDKEASKVILLEIQARLSRMSLHNGITNKSHPLSVNSTDVSKVESIAIYVAQHYSQPLTVSAIGKAVGLHPDYANAIFKKAFGNTLSEYITAERISHAQRKLLSTEKSITEIAFESGFNSIGRFNAAFQKINHCTPRDFRKNFGQRPNR
jgi:AraC family transcriptional regulator, melibiose operon regulatory protein